MEIKRKTAQQVKQILSLVREFDHLKQEMPQSGVTEEDRAAICNKFFNTLISREAFTKLLRQYPQASNIADGLISRLPNDMWVFLTMYFSVAEEPSELPMWYVTKSQVLYTALAALRDGYTHSLPLAIEMPFKDIIEIMLTHYDNLLQKELIASAYVVDEGPIITEI